MLEDKRPIDENLPGMSTVRKLGSGSHGRCYLMRREDDGQLVVHKRVPVSHMSPTDQEVAEREVNILASLSHPFIVRYNRAFVQQGQLCISMEYASGGDLAQRLESLRAAGERVDLTQGLDWFTQLLLALNYVHSYRVLHRDVSLKNVFLSAEGLVKLGDFGVARVLASSGELAITRVGTPCNVSPERCEGRPYSFASDVWALGCVLFEMLTNRPAFHAETIPALTEKIVAGAHAEITPDDELSPEVCSLIGSALTVDPEARPTVAKLLEAPLLETHVMNHEARDALAAGKGQVEPVDIPLVGYAGASKTKFSERPVFVEGGERIIEEASLSAHDEKLLGVRNRRQKQLAARRGDSSSGSSRQGSSYSGLSFDKVQNFGSSGLIGFLKEREAPLAEQ